TYNSAAIVAPMLESLRTALAGLAGRIVVADNGSTDDTIATIERAAPEATGLALRANCGYSAAINAAAAAAPATLAYFVLNPDVWLAPDCVELLLEALGQDGSRRPRVGITVPRLLDGQGRLQPSLRHEPTLRRMIGEAVLGARADRYA